MGKTMEQCKAEQAAKSAIANAAPFVLVFVGELIMAWAIYGILFHMNMFTLRAGVITGAACWFGFVLTTITVNNAFAGAGRAMLMRHRQRHRAGSARCSIIGAISAGSGRSSGWQSLHLDADRADQLAVFLVVARMRAANSSGVTM